MRIALALVLALACAGTAHADPLEIALQDPSVTGNPVKLERFLNAAKELGATHIHAVVTPGDQAAQDPLVDGALARGMQPELVITGRQGSSFTPDEFSRFVAATVEHFSGRVHRYSLINEPNCCGFLVPIGQDCVTYLNPILVSNTRPISVRERYYPTHSVRIRRHGRWVRVKRYVYVYVRRRGHRIRIRRAAWRTVTRSISAIAPAVHSTRACTADDRAQEYRRLYDVGYETAKKRDPSLQILVGEVTTAGNPMDFLRRVADAGTGPIVTDGIAIHPYFYSMAALVLHDRTVARTPGGGIPPTYFTENGILSRSTNVFRAKNVPEEERAVKLPQLFAQACATAGVRQHAQYEFFATGGTPWDTSIADIDGNPDASYYSLKSWIAQHPECVV